MKHTERTNPLYVKKLIEIKETCEEWDGGLLVLFFFLSQVLRSVNLMFMEYTHCYWKTFGIIFALCGFIK